ncbi:hypothetical protein HanRHA438_Chr15g0727951 [Helianthus annuus]|nr:hypothetical protein HanHA300_Chr15g0583621 [Helianthus annuus]KAJ0474759.1 hypothetical protein HanHA89_Chr15g0633411 [Helianthus annuus]KAJ0650313.1 hypothetical protein HanLR1_Chr15g0594321 [Helianthus annuus]KAJ0654085.1 hypothetical protein HanOQP8_Chr15g0590931 [Helianthus annuus]KAJ0846705.1 hypothetical protein HanRHA438_Chr15g0727951 [Helianthus annuus]
MLCNLITVHSQLISRNLRRVHSHPLTALINWHAYLCRGHLDYSSIVFLEVEFVVYTLLYAIYRFRFNKTLIRSPICCFLSMAEPQPHIKIRFSQLYDPLYGITE